MNPNGYLRLNFFQQQKRGRCFEFLKELIFFKNFFYDIVVTAELKVKAFMQLDVVDKIF